MVSVIAACIRRLLLTINLKYAIIKEKGVLEI